MKDSLDKPALPDLVEGLVLFNKRQDFLRLGEIKGQSDGMALDNPFDRLRALLGKPVSGLDLGAAPDVAPDNLGAGIGAGHR